MQIVISPERALADGISHAELNAVARWHEERAELISRSITQASKKRKPIGSDADARRHTILAIDIRSVAAEICRLQTRRAA